MELAVFLDEKMVEHHSILSISDAEKLKGSILGVSNWHLVTQEAVDTFGMVTGDQQWIHTDPSKAKDGPFGGGVVYGLFTLGLAGGLLFHETVRVIARMGVNYGSNRVRYPSPLLVGTRVKGSAKLKEVKPLPNNGIQLLVEMTVDAETGEKPVCVAEFIVRYFF